MKLLFPIILLILIAAAFLLIPAPREQYILNPGGLFIYKGISTPKHTVTFQQEGKEIVFQSRGDSIHAIYSLPSDQAPFPAFVVLPGGNVEKEAENKNLAKDLRSLGFATLVLDQRGIGETAGSFPPLDQQVASFKNKNEPSYHKMVADALNAVALLESFPEINEKKIYIAGVSMGGRTAIMAGAQNPDIKGILAISTGGFPMFEGMPKETKDFFASIAPEIYAPSISPNLLVMIHSEGDHIISLELAKKTFAGAKEPKRFYSSPEEFHGYLPSSHYRFLQEFLPAWK